MRPRTYVLNFVCLLLALLLPLDAAAFEIVFQTPGSLSSSATRPDAFNSVIGHTSQIKVGDKPVSVTQIGFYGRILAPASIAWVIYSEVDNSLPLFRTSPVLYPAAATVQWYESPAFTPFVLNANTTYYLGFIADGPLESVQFNFNDQNAGIPLTQYGLTLETQPFPLSANPSGSFASPRIGIGTSTVQFGVRLHIIPPPTLLSPAPSTAYSNSVPVSYTLPNSAVAGSLKLEFNDGISVRTLTLASAKEVEGTHEFSFSPANPEASPEIADGDPIPDGIYAVRFSYQDDTGTRISNSAGNVRLDRTPPVFTTSSQELTYTENSSLPIVPNPSASDAGWNGGRFEVQVSANASGADEIAITTGTGLTVSGTSLVDAGVTFGTLNVSGGGSRAGALLRVTFNGQATSSRVQRLLGALTFSNFSDQPSVATRSVRMTLADTLNSATTLTTTISVVAVNDAPVLTASNGTVTFQEGNGVPSVPVIVDSQLVLSDPDNTTLASATVTLFAAFASGEDFLSFTPNPAMFGNIKGGYSAATGVLTLTSEFAAATLAQWQAALRSVTYTNTSELPVPANRTARFVVSDGTRDSAAVNKTIAVVAVNDRPVATGQLLQTNEDTPKAITLTGTDVDSPALTYSVIAQPQHGTLSGSAPNLIYTPAPDFEGEDAFTFRANDGSSPSLIDATVSISVTAVNDQPTLGSLPDVEVPENWSASVVVPLGGLATGAANEFQTLTVTATSADPSLVPNPEVFYTSPESTGSITFKPAPEVNGTTTISVTVNDGGGENNIVTRTFTVTVNPVNSIPTFVKGANLSVAHNAGPQTVQNWATNISAGPADEAGQQLTFITTAEQPELFAQQPAVASNGTLTFAPAPGASGISNVSVRLRDDGGTANAGINESSVQTFKIAVTTFAEELGSYCGLVRAHPSTGRSHERAGTIKVQIQRLGNFTGKLRLGSATYPIRGRFDEQGVARFNRTDATSLALSSTSPALALSLNLDVENGTGKLTGTITSGSDPFSVIDADRMLYTAAKNPQPPYRSVPDALLGRYTVLLDPAEPARDAQTFPQGSGFGSLKVSRNGSARFIGKLADGTVVSHASSLSAANTWPAHFLTHRGRGSVSGRIGFEDVANVSDLGGSLDWFSPTASNAKRYSAGWPEGLTITFLGAKFSAARPPEPPSAFPGLAIVSPNGNAELKLTGVNFPAETQRLNIHPNNRVVPIPPIQNGVRLHLGSNGIFTGSFVNPDTQQRAPIKGAVLQKQLRAAGFFLSREEAGGVTITPAAN